MESAGATCTNAASAGQAYLMFTQLLTTLTNSYCDLNPVYPEDSSAKVFSGDEKYDFIVVGAGSAGSAIANRLSEVPSWKVLLIEAGPDPPVESNIPALWCSMLGTKYDWKFVTEKSEEACRSMVNRQCGWPKGKMLGGSSSINAMFYVRGNPKDYDNWEKLGNAGWSYRDVLQYFKKLEKVDTGISVADAHGYDGYVDVQEEGEGDLSNIPLFQKMIEDAAGKLGYPYVEDMVANMKPGVTNSWGTMGNGTRSSAAKAYLASIAKRKNLIVMKETLVTRLLVENNRTYGVEVRKGGVSKRIVCQKEVIVAAGAVNSPQLLMLSGIGPEEHLRQFGLPVVADLKVGHNLQDHLLVWNTYLKFDSIRRLGTQNDIFYNYLAKRTELDNVSLNTIMFFASSKQTEEYPDLQLHFFLNPPNNPGLRKFFETVNVEPEIVNEIAGMNENAYLLQMHPKLLRPKSRGRIMLASGDPAHAPKIVHGYLTRREDVDTLIEGAKFLTRLINTGSFANATLFVPFVKECKELKWNSDEYYECYIRSMVSTVYHVSGTCKMGPKSDPDAVVDSRLRVYGIGALRVADSSIMPEIVSGNTNIPTIMIGEKAADLIKEDWLGNDFRTTQLNS